MACDIDDREGESPSPMEPRLGRVLHSSATGRRRGSSLAEARGLRQGPFIHDISPAGNERQPERPTIQVATPHDAPPLPIARKALAWGNTLRRPGLVQRDGWIRFRALRPKLSVVDQAPAPKFDSVLKRMFQREGVDTLPAHLEQAFGISITKVSQLDVGVFRIDRSDEGASLVARLFSADRPYAAAEADLAVLHHLAELGFPAERPIEDEALTTHDGQAVLVTKFVRQVAKPQRPAYPVATLGARIAWLNGLPVPAGADRPAGALHHFAEGTMTDELRAVAGWLDGIDPARLPSGGGDAVETIRAAAAATDGGDGLPEALVHPDPVPKNAIFTAEGPILVDWTSAGRGPRLASMTLVLRSGWAAKPFLKGYSRVATLTADERDRLPDILFSRQLIDVAFRVCRDPTTAVTQALPASVSQIALCKRFRFSSVLKLVVYSQGRGQPASQAGCMSVKRL